MENLTFGLLLLANSFTSPTSLALASNETSIASTTPVTIVTMATSSKGYVVTSTGSSGAKKISPEMLVRESFKDSPIMIQVARCESHFRQYDEDGSIMRGVVDSRDVGVMQINEYYHLKQALKLGYDIYSLEGNIEYAKYLYEKEGTQPWSASEKCWSVPQNIAQK